MRGQITTGEGNGGTFVAEVSDTIADELRFTPFHGTLNIRTDSSVGDLAHILCDDIKDDHCQGMKLYPCRLGGVRTAILRPLVPNYPSDKVELIAPVRLRTMFRIETGDTVAIDVPDQVWPAAGINADPSVLHSFDAVVFDLDQTLLTLDVDWKEVFEDVASILEPLGSKPISEYDPDELMDLARKHNRFAELETRLRTAELEGATSATPHPPLDSLQTLDCKVGVCTANAVASARKALTQFGVLGSVDTIVGRDTIKEQKPHARPLTECLDRLDVAVGNAVFIGDSDRDAYTAAAAGTSFLHPSQLWSKG